MGGAILTSYTYLLVIFLLNTTSSLMLLAPFVMPTKNLLFISFVTATSIHPFIPWRNTFPIIAWTIWKARNKTTMEGVLFYPILTLTIAKSLVIDLFFSLPKKDPHVQFHIKFFSWTPPPLGSTKLNSDGSARGNSGQASAGGLIRDSSGNWINGYTRNIGFTTSLTTKL
jgi:hypothetical protein